MQVSELRVYDDFIQERRVQLKEIRNDRNRDLKYIYISYKYNGNTNDITGLIPSRLRERGG